MERIPATLRFRPLIKHLIWGGRRLGEVLGKPIGTGNDFAESWEVVDHGPDQSQVDGGPWDGLTLQQLVQQHRKSILGSESSLQAFPLLLKYLDCNRVLSVQVHPDDAYAMQMPKPDRGKTEAWYIIDAVPESRVYAGLRKGVSREQLAKSIEAGDIERLLHSFTPQPGDCVFIPAGTVHALGSGLLVAEIQQSSDTTFRLYDWNRVDDQGNHRKLHIKESLDVTNYDAGPVQPIRISPQQSGWQMVVDCDYFRFTALRSGKAPVGGDGKCHLLTVPHGHATVTSREESQSLDVGQSLMVTANASEFHCEVAEGSCLLAMLVKE